MPENGAYGGRGIVGIKIGTSGGRLPPVGVKKHEGQKWQGQQRQYQQPEQRRFKIIRALRPAYLGLVFGNMLITAIVAISVSVLHIQAIFLAGRLLFGASTRKALGYPRLKDAQAVPHPLGTLFEL